MLNLLLNVSRYKQNTILVSFNTFVLMQYLLLLFFAYFLYNFVLIFYFKLIPFTCLLSPINLTLLVMVILQVWCQKPFSGFYVLNLVFSLTIALFRLYKFRVHNYFNIFFDFNFNIIVFYYNFFLFSVSIYYLVVDIY